MIEASIATMDAVRVAGLSHSVAGRQVLHDLSLTIPEGSVFGLLGPNGAGKSTLIKLIMGLWQRRDGQIEVLGMDPRQRPTAVKAAVGYVPEQPSFYPWMRVTELIALVSGLRADWDAPYSDRLLDAFQLPAERKIRDLSKGQVAMVALLLALAFRPKLLILDEPTSALDLKARRFFLRGVLAEYQEDGGTLLISSHLIHEIAGVVDHVGILDQGRLVISAPEEALRASLRRFRLTFSQGTPVAEIDCPGVLDVRRHGRQVVVTVRLSHKGNGTEARAALSAYGPTHLEEEPLSLEDVFLELVS